MKLDTQAHIDAAERTLRLSWVIVAGAVLYSVLTVTPLVQRVTPRGWELTAPILPIVVDAAVVIVVRVDAIVARLDGDAGFWPALLRWLTGLMTLALNVGDSALRGDLVGVGVHSVAPTLLIVTAEAGLKWRRAITTAVERIEREQRAEREREQEAARREREGQEAADRERRREEREEREREREHAARLAREEREHEAQLEANREDRADARRREEQEREARERKAEADRLATERREQEAVRKAKEDAQEAVRARKAAEARKPALAPVSAASSAPRPAVSATVSTDAPTKMSEPDARQAVADGLREGRSQREIATLTGWSNGWVANRAKELEEAAA